MPVFVSLFTSWIPWSEQLSPSHILIKISTTGPKQPGANLHGQKSPKLRWNEPSLLRLISSGWCIICGWLEHICPDIFRGSFSKEQGNYKPYYFLTWSECWFLGSCQTLKWLRILLNPHSIPNLQVMNLNLNKDLVQDRILIRSCGRLIILTHKHVVFVLIIFIEV